MILVYGSYTHDPNSIAMTRAYRPNISATGRRAGYMEAWNIEGTLYGTSPTDLTVKMLALEAAYGANGGNLTLFQNDGATVVYQLLNANTLGGTRVTDFKYPNNGRNNSVLTTYQDFAITVEAEVANVNAGVLEWTETLKFSGGGSKFKLLQTLYGPPQKQIVQRFTPYRCVQSGSAVGHLDYPSPPSPLFPEAWHQDEGEPVVKKTPEYRLLNATRFPIEWNYVFESADPLYGLPSSPTG